MPLLNVGYGNMVNAGRLIAHRGAGLRPGAPSCPGRAGYRPRDRRRPGGHKTRSVLIMDSDHVVLSPLQPETVAGRMEGKKGTQDEEEEDT